MLTSTSATSCRQLCRVPTFVCCKGGEWLPFYGKYIFSDEFCSSELLCWTAPFTKSTLDAIIVVTSRCQCCTCSNFSDLYFLNSRLLIICFYCWDIEYKYYLLRFDALYKLNTLCLFYSLLFNFFYPTSTSFIFSIKIDLCHF